MSTMQGNDNINDNYSDVNGNAGSNVMLEQCEIKENNDNAIESFGKISSTKGIDNIDWQSMPMTQAFEDVVNHNYVTNLNNQSHDVCNYNNVDVGVGDEVKTAQIGLQSVGSISKIMSNINEYNEQLNNLKQKIEASSRSIRLISGHENHTFNSRLSLLTEIKKIEQNATKEKQEIIQQVNRFFDDIDTQCKGFWNTLGGTNTINSFEKDWTKWTIDDTVKWFDFVIKKHDMDGMDHDNDNKFDSECYSSSSSDDEENENDDNGNENDYGYIIQKLNNMDFRARKNLPYFQKSFHFKQIGFNKRQNCKILCKETKKLMKKYPNSKKKKHSIKDNEFQTEGFVEDTIPR